MSTKTKVLQSAACLILIFFAAAFSFSSAYTKTRPSDEPQLTPSRITSHAADPKTPTAYNHGPAVEYKEPGEKKVPKVTKVQQIAAANPTFTLASGKSYPLRTYQTLATNDPYGSQWWTNNTGLNTAWTIGSGSYQTTVAVIDTGFGLAHEELANRWATNSSEQGATAAENPSQLNCSGRSLALNKSCNLIDDDYDGTVDNESGIATVENPSHLNCTDRSITLDKSCNLVDDDSNGYVDDVTGWDFANNDASVQAGETNPNGSSTEHGTEVSGILAATGNNSKGLAGVDWSTKILPLQAMNDEGYGNTLTVGNAIYYAADRNVDVISVSLGSTGDDSYTRQAIQYAIDAGSIVVAASGNDGCNCMLYPANYPEVFAVGAQNASNQRASFSSYGNTLDILAPGEDMITTTWSPANPTGAYVGGAAGTSFATPYVSGLLSLARSHQPTASWGELTNALLDTASHSGLSNNSPYSSLIGSGYARAGSYLTRATTPAQPALRYAFITSTQSGILGSNNVFDCAALGNFPTAPLYEITSGSTTYFTIDPLEQLRAAAGGATIRDLGRACVGLPGDVPKITRDINLSSEINNLSPKQ